MATPQEIIAQFNADPRDIAAEYNETPYKPVAELSGVTFEIPGEGYVPIEQTAFGNLPLPFREAIVGAASLGATIESPILRLFGRADEADRNRRAVEAFAAYNDRLNADTILGDTVGPVVGQVTRSLATGTLSAGAGGAVAGASKAGTVAQQAAQSLSLSAAFGVDGADRAYVQAKDSGQSNDVASWAAARQFVVDGVGTLAGMAAMRKFGLTPGRFFGRTAGEAARAAGQKSGLSAFLQSALAEGGIEGVQGGLSYLNAVYSGAIEEFDFNEFLSTTGVSAAVGGLAGAAVAGAGELSAKFEADMKKAVDSVRKANTFAADATPEKVQEALRASTAKEFEKATGISHVGKSERVTFQKELKELHEMRVELESRGVEAGRSIGQEQVELDAEMQALNQQTTEIAEAKQGLKQQEGLSASERGRREAAIRVLEENIKDTEKNIQVRRKRLERRRAAAENEIGEQRSFLESELNRLDKEIRAEGDPENAIDVIKSVVEQPRRSIRLAETYSKVENIRSSINQVRRNLQRGQTPDVGVKRDFSRVINEFGGKPKQRQELLDEFAKGITPRFVDKLTKALDRFELATAKAEFESIAKHSGALTSEFRNKAKQVEANVNKKSVESLRDGSEQLRELTYQSNIEDRLLEAGTQKFVSDTAQQIVSEMRDVRPLTMKSDDPLRKIYLKVKGKSQPGIEVSRDWLTFDSPFFREKGARLEVVLERLSPTLRAQIWEKLGVDGQAKYELAKKETVQGLSDVFNQLGLDHAPTLDSTLSGHSLERWRTEENVIDGVTMTRDEALGLSLLAQDPQNREALARVGWDFPDGRKFDSVSDEILNQLDEFIGAEGQNIREWMFSYLNGPLIDRVNDAKKLVTGRPLTDRRDTVPRSVTDTWNIVGEDFLKAMQDSTVNSYRHLRQREGTSKPLTWPEGTTGGVDYFLNHADRMNRFSAFLPGSRDVNLLLNSPDTQEMILSKDGREGLKNIQEAIRSQVIGPRTRSEDDTAIRRWNGLNAGALLGGRLTTTFIQGMSTIASAAYDTNGLRDYMRTGLPAATSRENVELMDRTLSKHSGHFWARYMSQDAMQEQTNGAYQSIGHFRPPQLAFHGTRPLREVERVVNSAWRFKKARLDAERQGLQEGTNEWGDFVARAWERATYRGENTSHGMELSGLLRFGRDNPAFGTITTFQNTISKIYSLMPRAVDLAEAGHYDRAIQTAATALAATLPVAVLRQAMTHGKSDEPFAEAVGNRFIQDAFNLHPLGGIAFVPIIRRMQGLGVFQDTTALGGTVGEIGTAVGNWAADIMDTGSVARNKKEFFDHLKEVAIPVMTLYGVPVKGLDDFRRRLEKGTMFPGLKNGDKGVVRFNEDLVQRLSAGGSTDAQATP